MQKVYHISKERLFASDEPAAYRLLRFFQHRKYGIARSSLIRQIDESKGCGYCGDQEHVLAGVGGQGIILASESLPRAAIAKDYEVRLNLEKVLEKALHASPWEDVCSPGGLPKTEGKNQKVFHKKIGT